MRIWSFHNPMDPAFAEAHHVADLCYSRDNKRTQPLVIEWEPGSDVIADFTWTAIGTGLVATERVGKALLEHFRGFELGPVEMIQNPRLKRPTRTTRRTKPRVWLPYEGPPLYELWVTARVSADLDRSTLEIRGTDPDTGGALYRVIGDEHIEGDVDRKTRRYIRTRVPREPGKGLHVPKQELKGADMFQVVQMPWDACTDAVRDFILASEFTNVDFLEMGETF